MVEFSNLGLLENQSIIKLNVSTIQSVTDNLPNSGALTDIAQVVNQSIVIANQSTILDSFSTDATAINQTAIIGNQTSISDDLDIAIANTSTLLDNLSSGEIGDATLANQSLILLDGDYSIANQTIIITNQSTILDNIGGDATLANQSSILIDGDSLITNTSSLIQSNSAIDNVVDSIEIVTSQLPDSGALTSIGSVINQSSILTDGDTLIANTSTILDNISSGEIGDATLANQSLILTDGDTILSNTSLLIQSNATIDTVVDGIKSVTDFLPDSGALTSIGTLANQSLTLTDGDGIIANQTVIVANTSTILDSLGIDATAANQSIIITNQSTILDTIGGDASATNQTAILTNQTSISDNLGLTLANTSTILDTASGDATIVNQSTILQFNQTIDNIVDTIQVVTDALPDAGALTSIGSIANQSLILVDGDYLLSNTTSLINSNSTIDTVVDAIQAVTDNLPDSGVLSSIAQVLNQSIIIANQSTILDTSGGDATLANQSIILQFNQTIDNVVDNIKSVTDLLPDSGALTSIGSIANQSLILTDGDNLLTNTTSLIASNSTIDTVVDGIKTVTDVLPDAGALTSIAQVLNQSIIIANQSTILDTSGGDATSTNQSAIIANQTLISDDIDLTIVNTSSLIQTNSTIDSVVDAIQVVTDAIPDSGAMTSIGLISNQSLLLTDGDNLITNQSVIIANQSTILDTSGGDASAANQTIIIANQSTILDTLGGGEATIANQSLILIDGDNIIANTSSIIGSNATIDSVVDTIQAVTDLIPDSGAMTSIGSIANQSLILVDGDNLIANTSSLIQTNATIDNVVDTILTNTSSLLSNTTEVSGNYNLSTASGPHTVFTISVSERKRLDSIFLDLYNLSYANNIKIDHKIDGTNYRTIVNTSWAITDDDGMYFNKNLAFTHDVRLTMSNGTTANATVPYYYILESVE